MIQEANTTFLQSQPEIEVVDSAFDLQSFQSPVVTVINHSNKIHPSETWLCLLLKV